MDELRISRLFGSEYAQDDVNFDSYAIERKDLLDILLEEEKKLIVINAPRGAGKSGLLIKHCQDLLRKSPTQNRIIRKFYKDMNYPSSAKSIEGGIKYWNRQLLEWIILELAKEIKVPRTNEEVLVRDFATAKNAYNGKNVQSIDQNILNIPDSHLESLIENHNFKFWFLLDEMDDLFKDDELSKDRLASLLYVCRYISRLRNIFIRITIRPHILTYLQVQYDHIQQLRSSEMSLRWRSSEIKRILAKRIEVFDNKYGSMQLQLLPTSNRETKGEILNSIIARYFNDFDMSLRPDRKSEYRGFSTISMGRPRWLLEFCSIALGVTDKDYADLPEYKKAMYMFANNRSKFLAAEHRFHIPNLQALINGLGSARSLTFTNSDHLRGAIERHILGYQHPKPRKSSQEHDEALKIANHLFMVEVIRARQGSKKDYRFIPYTDRPGLLASWNTDRDIVWEIHPTFQFGLNIVETGVYQDGGEMHLFSERGNRDDGQE